MGFPWKKLYSGAKFVTGLLAPQIEAAVELAETTITGPGKGRDKAAHVLSNIETFLPAAELFTGKNLDNDEGRALIAGLRDDYVALRNAQARYEARKAQLVAYLGAAKQPTDD